MKNKYLLGAEFTWMLTTALSASATQIGLIDFSGFDGAEGLTTFDGLGLPPSNATPLTLDGNTYTTDNGTLRYDSTFSANCINECIGNDTDSGFIDIVLGSPVTHVGAFVGANQTWSGTVEFFSTTDALLGTISYNSENVMQFSGWEDTFGIGRFRLTDTSTDGLITHMENFRFASAIPIPAAAWLFGSGLLGLVGMARRKKA